MNHLVKVAMSVALIVEPLFALNTRVPAQQSRPPEVAEAGYDPRPRNLLDLWKAESDRSTPVLAFVHGGGFQQGDKRDPLNPVLVELCSTNRISLARVNYGLGDTAPISAPMHHAARAVQHLGWRAREWSLDPLAFVASGGSAGAGISLWLAFYDDLANLFSRDPVEWQSTRLSAAAVTGTQTAYAPRVIWEVAGEAAARADSLWPFWSLSELELDILNAYPILEEASPITHLSAGDPPVFLFHSEASRPVPSGAEPGAGIHHPRFGFSKEKLRELGMECVVRLREQYRCEIRQEVPRGIVDFLLRQFGIRQ